MKLRERAAEFVGEADQFDDMTMLCVKYLKKKTFTHQGNDSGSEA